MERGKEVCANCEKPCPRHFIMCDEETDDTVWCPECFQKTACSAGVHGEGCATAVFDDGMAAVAAES